MKPERCTRMVEECALQCQRFVYPGKHIGFPQPRFELVRLINLHEVFPQEQRSYPSILFFGIQ